MEGQQEKQTERGSGNEWDEQSEEERDFEDDMEACMEQGQEMESHSCENEKNLNNKQEPEGNGKGDNEKPTAKKPEILNMRSFRVKKKPASKNVCACANEQGTLFSHWHQMHQLRLHWCQ